MGKRFYKNENKNVIAKCSQKLLDHAEESATGELKAALKRVIQKQQK